MSTITRTSLTPADLLSLPDAVNYELVNGELVERNMGSKASAVAMRIVFELVRFLRDRPLGHVLGPDAGFQCFPDAPDKVRKPDVSFIRFGRLPADETPEGHCPIAPEPAVEVLSPNDIAYEVEAKVGEYLRAGVPLVWVVYPPTRTVHVYRPRSSPHGVLSVLGETDTITGEEVLPGFSCPVKAFFE